MTLKETVGKWTDIGGAAGTADTEELGSLHGPEAGPTVIGDSSFKFSGPGDAGTAGGREALVDPSGGDAGGDEGED
jgi:hypothetical protein